MPDNLSDEYGRRTLDFVTKMSAAVTRDEIIRLTMDELAWYGLTFLTSWSMPHQAVPFVECFDVNTRPADYCEHYFRENLLWQDPILNALRESLSSLTWSEVQNQFSLTKRERGILEEARDWGSTDGLTIPVFSAEHGVGVFGPCGWKPDLSPRARSALELVGLYAHQALLRAEVKEARLDIEHVPLTPREREIMRWVAVGKTNDEIADILTIGTPTVKTLLSKAQTKLNASRRTYAVVQAFRLGELDLNF